MRGVFFLPNLIGGILLGFTWQFIFVQAFEALGKATGIAWLQGWLSDTATSFVGLLIVVTWQLSGYMMVIYIAQDVYKRQPSGCGKSTTLRMIAGLEEITAGELYIGEKKVNNVAPKDRDIAMVFQNYALYPHMTCLLYTSRCV